MFSSSSPARNLPGQDRTGQDHYLNNLVEDLMCDLEQTGRTLFCPYGSKDNHRRSGPHNLHKHRSRRNTRCIPQCHSPPASTSKARRRGISQPHTHTAAIVRPSALDWCAMLVLLHSLGTTQKKSSKHYLVFNALTNAKRDNKFGILWR